MRVRRDGVAVWMLTALLMVHVGMSASGGAAEDQQSGITLIGPSTAPTIVHSGEKDGRGNPLVQYAAEDLQRYLKMVTGQELPFGEETAEKTCIYVGQTRYARALRLGLEHLDYDGFVICLRYRGDVPQLVIAGRTPYGTYLGVNYFLREYAGVQWLFPGKLGEVVPTKRSIIIPANLDDRQRPDFGNRSLSLVGKGWNIYKLRSLGSAYTCLPSEINPHPKFSPEWVVRSNAGHSMYKVLSLSMYDKHPEYFPLINGKRFKPKSPNVGWQPCLSNPDLTEMFIKAAQKYFDASPYNLCFSLAENDSGGYCQCDKCKAMDYQDAPYPWSTDLCKNYSDRSWKFYVKVAEAIAKSHPDRYLGVYSYLWSNEPPTDPAIKIPDNIIVRKTFPHESDIDRFNRWSKLGLSYSCHDYLYDGGFLEFRHYPHQIAEEIRFRHQRGLSDWHSEIYSPPSKCAPKVWILGRLLWNIDEDVDALMDEYCHYAYGKAAKPMRNFWDRWEDIYMRQDEAQRRCFYAGSGATMPWNIRRMSFADLDYLNSQIEQARKLADTEDDKARVEMVASEYSHSRAFLRTVLAQYEAEKLLVEKKPSAESLIQAMAKIQNFRNQQKQEWPMVRMECPSYSATLKLATPDLF